LLQVCKLVIQNILALVDFFLARQENEDVATVFEKYDLDDAGYD